MPRPINKTNKKLLSVIEFTQTIADSNRLNILNFLIEKEKCVSEIAEHIKQSLSITSHHLKKLTETGLVKSRKDGWNIYYSSNEHKLRTQLSILTKSITNQKINNIRSRS